MSGAARVYVTLDDIAEMMQLPDGHTVLAVDDLPAGYIPGLALIIVSRDAADTKLPLYKSTDPLMAMDLTTYRRWIADTSIVTRSTLRAVETPVEAGCADDCTHPDHRHGYTPARPPVAASPAANWPAFPGEKMDYRGATGVDSGDEDEHHGGPR